LVNRVLGQYPPEAIPAAQRERFRKAAAACMLRSMQMHREMHNLLGALAAAGIPVIPFKGPVLAERAYGDVGLRVFEDLDFLVPPGQVAAAVELVAGQGYCRPPEIEARGWARVMAETNEVLVRHASQPWVVELHWDFAKPWHRLNFSFDSLWAGIDPHSVGNRLDDTTSLLQLCVHGTSHYWDKIKWVVDVDRFVRSAPHLDWLELFRRAESIGCTRAVLLGLSLANSYFNLPLPATVMQQMRVSKTLAWPKRFVTDGWRQSGERKRPLWQRVLFILWCRETWTDRWLAIRTAAAGSRL